MNSPSDRSFRNMGLQREEWDESPWCAKHALLRNQAMREIDCPHCKSDKLLKALELIRDGEIPQGMSPALFAAKVLETL